ncbi:MAG: flagellar filament capping protein FliD [Fimbriimonadales bacterium]|nr:flagellar filament capping protein FliD [Fimbriimonadales bacterium]
MGFSGSGITFSGLASGVDTETIIGRILQLERRPIQRFQLDRVRLQTQQAALSQYKSLVTSLRSAASELNNGATFNLMSGTSSKSDVASITAGPNSAPGIYSLAVSKLAQAHKIATAAQSTPTEALGLSGKFLVNGKSVEVTASDSLTAIATKINAAGAGVIASIIDGGQGNAYLTLTTTSTGSAQAIALSDVDGSGALSALGLVSGAAAIRKPITNGAQGIGFADGSTPVGVLLGASVPAGDVVVNGVAVNIDFDTDSLSSIAAKINGAGAGATASVVTESIGGSTVYKLQITGASTPSFVDANGILENLGILQRGYGNELLAAQDAHFSIDGINLTSATNTVTTAIPGATITLHKANDSSPETTTITLQRDSTAIRGKLESLASAYNAIIDYLATTASFDKESLESGPLFGNSTVNILQSSMFSNLLFQPPGLSGNYRNLLALGVDFDSSGRMTIDSAKFEAALGTHLNEVRSLFVESGIIEDSEISFLNATGRTKASGIAGYEVIITQLATLGSFTSNTDFTSPTTEQETLTFNGSLFGNTQYQITMDAGKTLDDVIAQINADNRLKDLVTASKDGDRLVITSKRHGTPGGFTVKSNLEPGSDNTGIGTEEVSVVGLNVEGTINGEPASGLGQTLTGNIGNANTEGLAIQVSGGALGSRGTLIYSKGVATMLQRTLDDALDFVNGSLNAGVNALDAQMTGIDDNIKRLEEALTRKEESLRRRFLAMEQAISRLQAQTAQLGSLLANMQQQR